MICETHPFDLEQREASIDGPVSTGVYRRASIDGRVSKGEIIVEWRALNPGLSLVLVL
jgi:hypothetical protein